MGFLVPAFLVGMAAIAIPVIVHLLNKERKEVIRFPSLMFLERIPYRAIRKQTIRHPLLLALRALALLLLVAAFARPFFDRDKKLSDLGAGGTETVVLLDRSYSMGYGDRWDRAAAAVREAAGQMQPGDRVSLIAFDERAVMLAHSIAEGPALGPVMDTLKPGSRSTRLGPALAAAREVFTGSSLPRKTLLLVSDLQRSAWDGGSEGRIPANVETRIVSLADTGISNAMIARVDVDHAERGDQVLGTVVAQIRNQERRPVNRTATLEVQGRAVESKPVTLPPLGVATVRFTPMPVPPTASAATVSLNPDALASDDIFHTTLSRGLALPVLVLGRATASRGIFLQRALSLGEEPPFDVTFRSPESVELARLDGAAVIVLNNVNFPGGAAGRRLAERVSQGAGLIVITGEANDPARWNEAGSALVAVRSRGVVDRTGERGGRLSTLERSHRVFQPFAVPRGGDFAAARFLRYRALEPGDSATALAWYDDGNVALMEARQGRGRVLVWGSTLDDFWNDLVLQPVFLPFLHSMVRYAAGYAPDPAWRTLGQRVVISGAADSAAGPRTLVAPSGNRERLEGDRLVELVEPGFYQVQTDRRETTRLMAVNVDRLESELAAWDADELRASMTASDSVSLASESLSLTDVDREQRQRVWWFLLAAAALVLLVEVVLANRMSRTALSPR
jgi:hypothetical protein